MPWDLDAGRLHRRARVRVLGLRNGPEGVAAGVGWSGFARSSRGASVKILVLGGYGLIGSGVVDALIDEGHEVTGFGRSVEAARRRQPEAQSIAETYLI